MGKLERSHSQIWDFGPDGRVRDVITLGGHRFDMHGLDRQLVGLRLAWQWTRVSLRLWLQDLRFILGRKS